MVAKAGPETAITNAITNATVNNKVMRPLISAPSSIRAGLLSPAGLVNATGVAIGRY